MNALRAITGALVIGGGLNWGLVALAEFDLVAAIFGMEFGATNGLTRIVYGLVGLSAIYQAAAMTAGREVTEARGARSVAYRRWGGRPPRVHPPAHLVIEDLSMRWGARRRAC